MISSKIRIKSGQKLLFDQQSKVCVRCVENVLVSASFKVFGIKSILMVN